MKRAIVVAAALAALLAPFGAIAAATPSVQIAHLTKTVKHLRAQLRATQQREEATALALKKSRSNLASTEAELTASKGQASELQGTLTQNAAILAQTQASLDDAQANVVALQAQLNAIPTPLAVAVQQVQREVGWAENEPNPPYSLGALTALSAMNYVVSHVSTGAYGYLEIKGLPLPDGTANSSLGTQAGICGGATRAFAAIMQQLGYQVQSVQFYWNLANGTADNHIAVEAYYDNAWHYFDPTFGLYWTGNSGSVLSITDARSGGGTEHKDDVSFTNLIENPWFNGDDAAFETDPATTVVLDGYAFTD